MGNKMIKIDENGIRSEVIPGFVIVCERCSKKDGAIEIEGAEEHGEVGRVVVRCEGCGQWEAV